MKKNLYNVLQVNDGADLGTIEAAYQTRSAALMNAIDQESQNELKLIRQAYTILRDPVQKASYDKNLARSRGQDKTSIIIHDNFYHKPKGYPILIIVVVGFVAAGFYFISNLKNNPRQYIPTPTATEKSAEISNIEANNKILVAEQQEFARRSEQERQAQEERKKQEDAINENAKAQAAALTAKEEALRNTKNRLESIDAFIKAGAYDKARALAKNQDEFDYVNLKEQTDQQNKK